MNNLTIHVLGLACKYIPNATNLGTVTTYYKFLENRLQSDKVGWKGSPCFVWM